MAPLMVSGGMLQFDITIVDDAIAENMEEFTFMIEPTGANASLEFLGNGPFTVSITDNDGEWLQATSSKLSD